jgi:hypothetical protein
MDIALTSSILHAATAQTQRETSDAVQVAVLKKAMQAQASAAMTLLEAVPQPPASTPAGPLGHQLDTYA